MRKALTVSAITLAASMAIAAPATAFAADASPSPSTSATSAASDDGTAKKSDDGAKQDASDKAQAKVAITSTPKDKTGYKAGELVTFTVTTSGKAKVSASSDALTGVSVTAQGDTSYTGTGTVKEGYGIGTGKLTVTVNYPDTGAQSTATFPVNTGTAPKPDPAKASMSLSTDGGKVGDKVGITIKSGDLKGDAYVQSDVFGGKVKLARDKSAEGTWHGTATVSQDAKTGYYGVKGYVGSTLVDTAKFGVQGSDKPTPQPTPGKSTLAVTPGSGKAGDKIALTVDAPSINPKSNVSVDSSAFGGKVSLTLGKDGKWHGSATVAQVKPGRYDVNSSTGAKTGFTVTKSGAVKPLKPSEHKTPHGSVNTGMAPAWVDVRHG
ncbi:hypothetical protein [Streptomyces indicus]|uniref:Ig-like domain (Group 3) n=1 Tax=Streptomyces indicus TaxID=417292 RepID=A0A1G9HU61_9ACTN|nr:hypothetical protein [Streptomyces indicus]SDL16254.1 hypothetical protein SAMN05421806_12030 [Streptomyces indicus]